MEKFHKPVLLKESLKLLNVCEGERYIDATVGGGGHAAAILKKGGLVLGIDCDPEAIKAAGRRLSQACPAPPEYVLLSKTFRQGPTASWRLAQGNFTDLKTIALKEGFKQVGGVLFDLGVSTHQLATPARGFSFNTDAPLDMRMDPGLRVLAADLINGLNKGELDELFSKLGEEHHSRRIAESICRARRIKPIETTKQLAEIILRAAPKRKGQYDRIHPATRCFMALRMAVNDELNSLKRALPQAIELLKPQGRVVVISFHSGEDRMVKQYFKKAEQSGELRLITAKPVRPANEEVEKNPRSRSAKLRAAQKIK